MSLYQINPDSPGPYNAYGCTRRPKQPYAVQTAHWRGRLGLSADIVLPVLIVFEDQ